LAIFGGKVNASPDGFCAGTFCYKVAPRGFHPAAFNAIAASSIASAYLQANQRDVQKAQAKRLDKKFPDHLGG
jgi:hypothetical protein